MRLHLTTLLLLLLSFTTIAGDGKYYSLENLDPMVNQTMEIVEPSYNGQDNKIFRNYRGFVFLDYARQDQSDLLIWQTDWRCDVYYKYHP